MSWLAWKVSGLPVNRVIGSGTHLDTARFRTIIANRIGVATQSVHGLIIGEHGESQGESYIDFSKCVCGIDENKLAINVEVIKIYRFLSNQQLTYVQFTFMRIHKSPKSS